MHSRKNANIGVFPFDQQDPELKNSEMVKTVCFCYRTNMIKVIYFDYHGVLDRRHFHGLLDVIAEASGQPNPEQVALNLESYGYAYAIGQVSPHEFWRTIEQRYGTTANRAGRKYMLRVEPVREMWNLVSQLHDRYELGLFSDCATDKKEVIRSAYALTDYFDYLLFSCDTKLSKRDPEFYTLMLQNGLYQPEECLLIDDEESNCALAIDRGFPAHLFQDESTLRGYLERTR